MSAGYTDFLRRGLSPRQYEHWTRQGWLRPDGGLHPGSGKERRYPYSELRVAELMCRLANAGLSPRAAHDLVRALDADCRGVLAPGVLVEVAP